MKSARNSFLFLHPSLLCVLSSPGVHSVEWGVFHAEKSIAHRFEIRRVQARAFTHEEECALLLCTANEQPAEASPIKNWVFPRERWHAHARGEVGELSQRFTVLGRSGGCRCSLLVVENAFPSSGRADRSIKPKPIDSYVCDVVGWPSVSTYISIKSITYETACGR